MRKITVAQVITGFASAEGAGGSALFGIEVARALDKSRFRPILCGIHRFNAPSEQRWLKTLADEGIETRIMVQERSKLRYDMVRFSALLNQLIQAQAVDIIHTHVERVEFFISLQKLLHPSHYPKLVRTIHVNAMWVTRPLVRRLMNIVYTQLFGEEIAISQATKTMLDQRMAAKVFGRSASLIQNSLPLARLQKFDLPKQHQRFSPPRFLVIGRLEIQKAQDIFIQAAALVLQQYPEAEFWLAGEGTQEANFRQLTANLAIEHAVKFLGPRGDIPEVLSQVDVLVSTSRWEGFATVILEAMAARTPVIATDIGGNNEQIVDGENGRLVASENPSAVADAMIWMLEHPQATALMAQRGYEWGQQFTMERTAAQYGELYERLLREQKYRP
ncbi:MAG TPA: glycosyltransferase family 4 protein [Herpetosiphon sp.]|uniref:Glycosyl transferase group 1 n=1 Tax=Herpetosiphon aurantiacus (strain ATCC 23779 / DSM 785 / 114-95) TaxID=316274 RepID=A9B860_HERA2|nr:glycosyltransferase family 4 protein [Herpetosiphon sp.]ABX05993.1 glycosyl transferase group 1 [Herpetosiphon aurantiacus DSM 785]HBW49501.1 glycosyltransferase family 4 protein [Herpetosiphon sp.]